MTFSKVDAINLMLDLVGEDSISALQSSDDLDTSTSLDDAGRAERFLLRTSKEVQARGWNINTNYRYAISPDKESGYIIIPDSWLRVDTVCPHEHINVTTRKIHGILCLYNKNENTFNWASYDSVYIEYVEYLNFEDLNFELQNYIAYLAGMKFNQSTLGSLTIDKSIKEQLQSARSSAFESDSEQSDINMLKDNPHSRSITFRRNEFWGY